MKYDIIRHADIPAQNISIKLCSGIENLHQRIKDLEMALRQLMAHNKTHLRTHVSDRERLKSLVAQGEKILGDDDGPD